MAKCYCLSNTRDETFYLIIIFIHLHRSWLWIALNNHLYFVGKYNCDLFVLPFFILIFFFLSLCKRNLTTRIVETRNHIIYTKIKPYSEFNYYLSSIYIYSSCCGCGCQSFFDYIFFGPKNMFLQLSALKHIDLLCSYLPVAIVIVSYLTAFVSH